MAGVAGAAEPFGPVFVVGEFFAPAGEVEADFALVVAVFEAVVGLLGSVGGGAGIVIDMGLFDHIGGGGILFDVEESGAVLGGGLDGFGVEVMAPEVAGESFGLVDFAGVVGLEVLHEAGDAPFGEGFEQEVDVIGHQAEGVDTDAEAAGEAIELVEVADEMGAGVEDALASASALIDVVDLADVPVTQAGRGGVELFAGELGHLLISGIWAEKFSFIFGRRQRKLWKSWARVGANWGPGEVAFV